MGKAHEGKYDPRLDILFMASDSSPVPMYTALAINVPLKIDSERVMNV